MQTRLASRTCDLTGSPGAFRKLHGARPASRVVRPAAFSFGSTKEPKAPVRQPRETVIPAPSFNVPLGLLAIAGVSAYEGVTPLAGLAGLLGAFLAFQATRVSFVFDDEALEVVIAGTEKPTDNKFVGGRNRWAYDAFINWEFWWPGFPILVYFKESQTKPEGQIHFFPIIFDGKVLYNVMLERCGPTQNSGKK